jgi:hypothetical protein
MFSKKFCHPTSVAEISAQSHCFKLDTTTSCEADGCAWSTAKELIPDSDFCFPKEMTNDEQVITGCTARAESDCLDKCNWYKGTGVTQGPKEHCVSKDRFSSTYAIADDKCLNVVDQAACANLDTICEWKSVDEKPTTPVNPTTPAGPTPLFTKEFCHPVKIESATAEGDFAACLQNPAANCNGDCKWSNGMSLIPDSNFCAPAALTDDVKQIMSCINAKGEAVCAPPCKWRRGNQPATNLP